MCVLLITRLLRGVGRWARKPVNHTSWVAVVTPTDRPKSVRNCCLIELFCGVVCVVTLPLWHFCWYGGFCHRTGSDLLLFVLDPHWAKIRMGEFKAAYSICWKTFPAKTTKMLSTRNSSILMMSSSEYLCLESECSFKKCDSSWPKTRYLYLRLPFLNMKEFRMILASLLFSLSWGIVV